jgi:DNA-binding PadR family transcriptional regulator
MTEQRPTTSLGYALVGLIHLQPQSGYDLRKIFETTPMGHYSSSPGAIYPALKRLERQGLIRGEVAGGDTMRPKRVYQSTARGVEALRRWVSQPIDKGDLVRNDDELMLRFAFMGSVVDDDTTIRFLEQMLEALEVYIPELRQVLSAMPDEGPPHGRLALISGIEMYKTRRRWVRRALAEFAPDVKKRSRK